MRYKINQPIVIKYLEANLVSGIIDLYLIITAPNGVEFSPTQLIETSTGIYESSFKPSMVGYYWIRVQCISHPENIYTRSYLVLQELTDNLIGESPTYIANAIGQTVGANKIFCNLYNISLTQIIKIQKVIMNVKIDGIGTGHQISFSLQRSSSSGSGIFGGINKCDTLASSIVGSSWLYSLTTSPHLVSGSEFAGGNLYTEESGVGMNKLILYESGNGLSPIILRQNEGLVVKQDGYASNGKVNIFYYFTIDNV